MRYAHLKSGQRYSGFRDLPTDTTIFLWFMTVEKADLSKGYQNPKRKLGLTTGNPNAVFSYIITI